MKGYQGKEDFNPKTWQPPKSNNIETLDKDLQASVNKVNKEFKDSEEVQKLHRGLVEEIQSYRNMSTIKELKNG